jgi:tRNA threonylcarbamoyladenosine biosynthesis protein TsaB
MPPVGADMNLLAFDTCFAACSVTVRVTGEDGRTIQTSRFEAMMKGHAEALFPMIDWAMHDIGATYADLDGLAVTVGPGSFTGTRVGISAARGLALATGLPVFGTTSLAAIAARARRLHGIESDSPVPVMVCHDARRDQVYTQLFGNLAAAPMSGPAVMSLAEAASLANRYPGATIVGTGAHLLTAHGISNSSHTFLDGDGLPEAEALLEAELERIDPPRTLYLRPPDAKPQSGKSIARVQ